MKNYFPLALVAIVLVAGCTSNTGTASTSGGAVGLSITSFTANPAEARGGQAVLAKMVIENQGQRTVDAADNFVVLIKPSDWNFNTESETASKQGSKMQRPLGEQKPVPRTYTWSLKAPASQGADVPVDLTGRIYYKYETNASGTINVYPDSELERATETAEFTSSKGPIEIAVEVNPNPPVIYSNDDEFTLTIHVKNKGNGVVFKKDDISKDSYDINPETQLGKVALEIIKPAGLTISDSDCVNNIQFFGTSKEEITTCSVKVDSKPVTKAPYRITVKANYGYYDEAKARVILKAR